MGSQKMNNSTPVKKITKGIKTRRILRWISAVLIIIGGTFIGLYIIGSSGYKYSDDQLTTIHELGRPDSFFITFSTDEDGIGERFEEWYFHDHGLSVIFYNGNSYMFEALDPLPENSVRAPYEPKQFDPYMRWRDVMEQIGQKPSVRASDYYPELFSETGIELYYSEQLVIGVEAKSNRLLYVETMVLVPKEET
jgi:hypothetical protein